MQSPWNKAELETVLGMTNHLAKFASYLSEMNAPLRQLLKHDSELIWEANHYRASKQMKDLVTQQPGPVLS